VLAIATAVLIVGCGGSTMPARTLTDASVTVSSTTIPRTALIPHTAISPRCVALQAAWYRLGGVLGGHRHRPSASVPLARVGRALSALRVRDAARVFTTLSRVLRGAGAEHTAEIRRDFDEFTLLLPNLKAQMQAACPRMSFSS